MDEDRDSQNEGEGPAPGSRSEWKQLVSTGVLLAAVLAILAAGAALRAEKNLPPPAPAAASAARSIARAPAEPASPPERKPSAPSVASIPGAVPAPAPPAGAVASPQPPSTSPPADANDLERRASRDRQRLSRKRGSFTAQVAVTCKPDNTRRILREAGGSERLFLIPLPDREPTCYRVCWGLYPNARDAAAAADLPAFLRRDGGRPSARPVAEIAP